MIKSRLFKWIIRGPVTASLALGLMTIVRRAGVMMGVEYTAFVPLTMVATVLLFEHAITLFYPLWERYLFFGSDQAELRVLQNMEERLLTQGDLQQFLEAVLAAVRDHMQSPAAFVAALDEGVLSLIVMAGNRNLIEQDGLGDVLEKIGNGNGGEHQEFISGKFWMLPLHQRKRENMDVDEVPPLLGLMGVAQPVTILTWKKINAIRSGFWRIGPCWLWKTACCRNGSFAPSRIYSRAWICSSVCAPLAGMIAAQTCSIRNCRPKPTWRIGSRMRWRIIGVVQN